MRKANEHGDKLQDLASVLDQHIHNDDILSGCRVIDSMMTELQGLTYELVIAGAKAGITNKALAGALGIKPSLLRGLREEAQRV